MDTEVHHDRFRSGIFGSSYAGLGFLCATTSRSSSNARRHGITSTIVFRWSLAVPLRINLMEDHLPRRPGMFDEFDSTRARHYQCGKDVGDRSEDGL